MSLKGLAKKIENSTVLLLGKPWVGKTYLCHELAGHFKDVYYFRIDKNFQPHLYPNSSRIIYMNVKDLEDFLKQIAEIDPHQALIVVDSLTLAVYWLRELKSPVEKRIVNIIRQAVGTGKKLEDGFYDYILYKLSKFKRHKNTIIVTAHTLEEKAERVKISVGELLLRQVEWVLWLRNVNGVRKLECLARRGQVVKPSIEIAFEV